MIVTAATNPSLDFGYGVGYLFEPMRDASPANGFARLECDGVTDSPTVGAYSYKFRVP